MIEQAIADYGLAVGMIIYFISDKAFFQRGLQKLVDNNTKALTKVYEVMSSCKGVRRR